VGSSLRLRKGFRCYIFDGFPHPSTGVVHSD
jgi:hypothetical protein